MCAATIAPRPPMRGSSNSLTNLPAMRFGAGDRGLGRRVPGCVRRRGASMSPRCLASALALAHRGLPVFLLHSVRPLPGGGFVCTCGKLSCGKASGKHPLGSLVPHGCKQASCDPRVIKHWWHCVDYANIGVATGDGLVVLDVDPRANGDQTLGDLEAKHGGLPRSWRVITGGGGEHIYFRSCAPIGCSASQIGPGLDVRARGG